MNELFVWDSWVLGLLLERSLVHVELLIVGPSAVRSALLIWILVISLSQFFSVSPLGECVIGTTCELLGFFFESILV
jgi:hypothetical protein